MKIIYGLTLLLVALSAASAKECCLCEKCEDVHPTKIEMFTLSPLYKNEQVVATCDEIAIDILDNEEDSEVCAAVRVELQEACCTDIVRK